MTVEGIERVKVAVRVRPFNKREIELGTKCCTNVSTSQILLSHPGEEKQPKVFSFDHCFNSVKKEDVGFADQREVFEGIGYNVIDHAFQGYNLCIFAYGQTGSGKSYTMMGSNSNPGIIPRLCNSIFERIEKESSESLSCKVEVSYMEIYNEKVRDLLDPKNSTKHPLKVREHKIMGPTVDGLSILAVSCFEQIEQLIDEGNKSRTVAATNMNATSSRSHAVFTIRLAQTIKQEGKDFCGEKVAKISLVDLAGSERAQKTGAIGKRLEEGSNINKSLTTLGMVISALAERSKKKEKFVPYRDSVLTWLLKDNLGGNSKTIMVATVSPSSDNFEETLSTLRYADRAKSIENHAVVNEDPNAKIIRELREEVESLRQQITITLEQKSETQELRDRLIESERLVTQMNKSWEERLKDTDLLYAERQKDLSEIGIALTGSGIKVEKDRFYLVNLNADPSMNELLVYYINEKSVIGASEQIDNGMKNDILLQGLGVHAFHARMYICEEGNNQPKLFIEPLVENARICVNGRLIVQKTLLKNGFRLLIGNNHFFKVNCPKEENVLSSQMNMSIMEESFFDFDKAWSEVNTSELNTSGQTEAVDDYIEQLAIKYQEDKQTALERQYDEFEKYIKNISSTFTAPSTPMTPGTGFLMMSPIAPTPSCNLPPISFPTNPRVSDKTKFFKWAQKRDKKRAESIEKLKKEIMKAHALVREANMISEELMGKRKGLTCYDVTLQIPAANLRPAKIKTGHSVCEPVIIVKRQGMAGHQSWSIEQLENKLVDMREAYNERFNVISESVSSDFSTPSIDEAIGTDTDDYEDCHEDNNSNNAEQLWSEAQEKHKLIGVANVFLEVLFHDMKLNYKVPILNQQGIVCGKLHVEIYRVPDQFLTMSDSMSESTESNESNDSGTWRSNLESHSFFGKTITCRVRIKRASSLPQELSNFVFCQYSFFNMTEMLVVAPKYDPNSNNSNNFDFEHQKDFNVVVTEEFLEYIQEDALSLEVWGHRSCGFGSDNGVEKEEHFDLAQKQKTLHERWTEVGKRLELCVEIKELNDNGDYKNVEVTSGNDLSCGGVYQLKHGQQKRIVVSVKEIGNRGILPLIISEVVSVSIGSIQVVTSDNNITYDSYQEEDLDLIKDLWATALKERHKYLSKHIAIINEKGRRKSSKDNEREKSLINQWLILTEERNAVSVPTTNSSIPGAPSNTPVRLGYEKHVPVAFLNLNSEELTSFNEYGDDNNGPVKIVGLNSLLIHENCLSMLPLGFIEKNEANLSVTCPWDSSIHGETCLNRVTHSGERIYAIVRVNVRISQPVPIDLILRKRICLNIYKKPSLTEMLIKRIVRGEVSTFTSVFYDVVAQIPKASLEMEDRESLAMLAAASDSNDDSGNKDFLSLRNNDGVSFQQQMKYIEAYTKTIQDVECMLKLDRLRQEAALFNMIPRHERAQRMQYFGTPSNSFRMKRTVSLPNTMNLPPLPLNQSAHIISDHLNNQGSPQSEKSSFESSFMSSSISSGTSSMSRPTFLNLKTISNNHRISSLVSPIIEMNTRLDGIDEERILEYSNILTDHYVTPIEADILNGNPPSSTTSRSNEVFSRTNRLFKKDKLGNNKQLFVNGAFA